MALPNYNAEMPSKAKKYMVTIEGNIMLIVYASSADEAKEQLAKMIKVERV